MVAIDRIRRIWGGEDYLKGDSAGKRKRLKKNGRPPEWRGRRKLILSRGDADEEVGKPLEKGKME